MTALGTHGTFELIREFQTQREHLSANLPRLSLVQFLRRY